MSKGVSATLLQSIASHQGDVLCCAFSGRLLAIGSADKLVRLFALDPNSQGFEELPQSPLVAHSYAVNSAAFTPLGTLLATASQVVVHCSLLDKRSVRAVGVEDGKLILWDVRTGRKSAVLQHESRASLRVVAFSPDARLMATGSDDETLALWDVASKKHIRSMEGHESSVVALGFSPDGSFLCSGSNLGDIRFWDARFGTGRHLALVKEAHDLGVTCLQFSPSFGAQGSAPEFGGSGTFLLATGGTDNLVKLWRVNSVSPADGDLRVDEYTVLHGHTQNVMSISFTPSGHLLASGSGDRTIMIWDPSKGCRLSVLEHHSRYVTSVAWSSDGTILAAGSNDKSVSVWKVMDAEEAAAEAAKLPPEQEYVRRRSCLALGGVSEVKNVTSWTMEEVGFWLQGLHLPQYKDSFKENLIDGQELVHLSETMLKNSLNVEALGHRNRILRAVKSLRDRYNIPSHPKSSKPEGAAQDMPHEYFCPITHDIMTDPVIAADGYTYERTAIGAWMEGGKRTSPMTNAALPHLDLTPNRMLKMLIQKNVKL